MRKLLLLTLLLVSSATFQCFSQAGEWTWMKGSNGGGSTGYYGTKGVEGPLVEPPGLYEPQSWTDLSNNLWLFGGVGWSTSCDLWKYNIATGNWTWMNGTGVLGSAGVYGTMGIPSSNNHPGSRGYGSASWIDSVGNLWLFAGWGYDANGAWGPMNDLWKYDIVTNEWTWMQGSNTGYTYPVFGSIGVPAAANTPGNRYEFNTSWRANDYTFWLFGGECQGSIGTLNRSDMWKYDPSTNEWAWMQGPGAAAGYTNPVYGTMGVPDPLNTPGSRSCYTVSTDNNGKFWMFGGYKTFSTPVYNDVWMFDPDILQWTWMGGTSQPNNNGFYIQLCDTQTYNVPKSRLENKSSWSDACGNLWTFGGESGNNGGALHDLWVFETATMKWKWIKGNNSLNTVPTYGTIQVSAPANDPGGRSGPVTWTDTSGGLWLFGGFDGSFNTKSDLWRFVIDPACVDLTGCIPQSAVAFGASDLQICQKFCIDFFDSSGNNPTAWQWEFPGGSPASSSDQNPANICYNNPGLYDVTLITTNANGTDTLTMTGYVTVYATPTLPVITQSGYTLTASAAATYQWQFNSVDIPGATNQSYSVTQSGYYTVLITDANGCAASATTYVLITGTEDPGNAHLFVYPNPSDGKFIIEWKGISSGGNLSISILNMLGQTVFLDEEISFAKDGKLEIDLCHGVVHCAPTGIYFLEIKTRDTPGGNSFSAVKQKIIITR